MPYSQSRGPKNGGKSMQSIDLVESLRYIQANALGACPGWDLQDRDDTAIEQAKSRAQWNHSINCSLLTQDGDVRRAQTRAPVRKRYNKMQDFLTFKKMITPVIIQIAFWIGVVVCIIAGIASLGDEPIPGILLILLGPLGVRIYCELIIVIFSINDTLTQTRNLLRDKTE
jgi:hypothetical protein